MDREAWRWVVGYEGLYMVSNMGNVMSVPSEQIRRERKYKKPGIEVRHHDNGKGYRVLSLYKDGVQHQVTVHRLVAQAFIPNPKNLPQVNHKDGDKSNNRVSNLEWVTAKENTEHAINSLGHDAGGANRIFTEEEVIKIRSDDRSGREIASEYGTSATTIDAIRSGRTYSSFSGHIRKIGHERERKLTSSQVIDIRTSDKSGVELASIYGVAASTICKIRKGQRYKEIKND